MNTVRRGKRQVKGEEPKRVTLADFALHAPADLPGHQPPRFRLTSPPTLPSLTPERIQRGVPATSPGH